MALCQDLEKFVQLDSYVRELGVHVAYTASWLEETVNLSKYPFEEDVFRLMEYIKLKYTLESLKSDRIIRAYRDFYWRIRVDPTKTRPSNEALVRRILRGEFPRINPVVDAGNIASAYTMVPIGMYDLDKATPPLLLRLSRGGETFKPIGGREELLSSGLPVLVDYRDVVVHVYPHRDSAETCISSSTRKVLTVAAGVLGVERELLVKAIELVTTLLGKIGWKSCGKVVYKI